MSEFRYSLQREEGFPIGWVAHLYRNEVYVGTFRAITKRGVSRLVRSFVKSRGRTEALVHNVAKEVEWHDA